MSRGTGRFLAVTLCACALGLVAVPSVGAGALDLADSTSTTAVVRGGAPGATTAAGTVNTLTINGKPVDGRLTVFEDVNFRLTILSPEGVMAPGIPQCTQDSVTQVSCDPGFIGAINAHLLEGNDTFKAQPDLRVIFGLPINGQKQPLDGGPGRDRIVGAAAADHLIGGAGHDNVTGNANG